MNTQAPNGTRLIGCSGSLCRRQQRHSRRSRCGWRRVSSKIITEQLYQKTPEQLTEAQKQTVTALSQLASGLAGGLISDSTAGAINAAEIGKRAVEDNGLLSGQVSDLF